MAKIDEQLFSDIYFTPEQVIYVHDGETRFGLKQLEVDDAQEFRNALERAYNGRSSYSMAYGSTMYRVQRGIRKPLTDNQQFEFQTSSLLT